MHLDFSAEFIGVVKQSQSMVEVKLHGVMILAVFLKKLELVADCFRSIKNFTFVRDIRLPIATGCDTDQTALATN